MAFNQNLETSSADRLLDDHSTNLFAEAVPAAKWYQIAYYQPYFQVDSHIAWSRISKSVYSLGSQSFFGRAGPDLYCPYWIITTLIICICICGNGAVFLDSNDKDVWIRGVYKISTAASMLYSLAVFVPLVCHCLLKRFHSHMSYVELLSLYGYSWTLFIPASVAVVHPSHLVRVTVLGAVAAWSYLLLLRNILREAEEAPKSMKVWLGVVSLSGHAIFVLSCVRYFYA
jgi:hypothetical protein